MHGLRRTLCFKRFEAKPTFDRVGSSSHASKRHGERIHQHGLDGSFDWRFGRQHRDRPSIGKETTLTLRATTAKTKPIPVPKSDQFPPLLCVEEIADELREGVRRRGSKERHVKSLGLEQPATKITSNKRPSDRMGNIACERTTPNACFHELARPSSRARLISYKPIPAKAPIRAKQKREDQMRRCDGKDRCERQGRRHLTHPTSPWLSPQTIRTWPSMSGLISPSGSKSSMTARSFPISQAWDAG